MSKAIMISDHAKWCALMMNGIKKIEVRKSKALAKAIQKLINENGYAEIYVYCTKGKLNLICDQDYNEEKQTWEKPKYYLVDYGDKYSLNGKIVARFYCYKVEEIWWTTNDENPKRLFEESCLSKEEIGKYLSGNIGYAIHISNLEIFDIPKELGEFRKYCDKRFGFFNRCLDCKAYTVDLDIEDYCAKRKLKLTKAPQSFTYIEVEE